MGASPVHAKRSSGALRILLPFGLGHEPVSHTTDRQQMPRLGGIVFNIAPQSHNKIIDGSSVSVFVQSPDFSQNFFAGNDAAAVANQMAQQFRLHQSQLNRISLDSQFQLAKINDASVE